MYANEFWQHRNAPQGKTEAQRKPSQQDILRALPDPGVDYHVAQATERE
jgi:hypothetical protein